MTGMGKVVFAAQVAAAAGLIYVAGQAAPGSPAAQDRPGSQARFSGEHVPGEVLVQYHARVSGQARAKARGRVGADHAITVVAQDRRGDGKGDLELLRFPSVLSVAAAVRRLEADPAVEFAEPNFVYYHAETSNDPYYVNGSLWGMYGSGTTPANEYGSQAGSAWAAGSVGSATVWVGIIDEGYMFTHEDLAANAGVNPGETPGNGIDDDGNGYVDDVYGWDFDADDNTVFDGTADDHGTHVAGTIGAAGGNGKGVAGVSWNVRLMDAKFLGRRGGTTDNAIRAVDYFTDLKTRHGLDIVATNNSWGGGGFSQALQDAIERANDADILFVAAAGNAGDDIETTPYYPASYPNDNVIAVASITSTGALSSFSNYGATRVDLGAPGSGIYSTVPVKVKKTVTSGYASYSGTSMATPHVSGAAALYAAAHPGATAAQIKAAILGAALPTASLAGKCVTGGRLDVSGF